LNPFGRPMATGQFGGEFARDIARAGKDAMVDFALAALADAFGNDIRRHVAATAVTGWGHDPYIAGAYSCARPGHAGARAVLAEPVGDRLFFAGEAVSPDFFSTAHGAHLAGIAQARRALKA
ncbi:MAG: FAD-dependent oxidoreductase, partial [Rhodobiaceae bacterium]|nr:FAD-dependent oxidoreductase [Rhodobiaceae bacterium]